MFENRCEIFFHLKDRINQAYPQISSNLDQIFVLSENLHLFFSHSTLSIIFEQCSGSGGLFCPSSASFPLYFFPLFFLLLFSTFLTISPSIDSFKFCANFKALFPRLILISFSFNSKTMNERFSIILLNDSSHKNVLLCFLL